MSITVRDFSNRSYCSDLLPLRDFSALEQGRTFADRELERRVQNREEKESIRTFRNTCDASTVFLSQALEIFCSNNVIRVPLRVTCNVNARFDGTEEAVEFLLLVRRAAEIVEPLVIPL